MHLPMVCIWFTLLAAATYADTGHLCITLKPDFIDSVASFFVALCLSSIFLNISLFVFNLFIPAYPLDGGRLLVSEKSEKAFPSAHSHLISLPSFFQVGFLLTCGVEEKFVAWTAIALSVLVGAAILMLGILAFDLLTILVSCWLGCIVGRSQVRDHKLEITS